jgi:hypothetical protein
MQVISLYRRAVVLFVNVLVAFSIGFTFRRDLIKRRLSFGDILLTDTKKREMAYDHSCWTGKIN